MLGVVAKEERGRNLGRNKWMIGKMITITIRVVVMVIERIKMAIILIINIIVKITLMRGMGEDCEL